MSATPERQFPIRCPGCNRLVADVAEGHCKHQKKDCAWLRCNVAECGTVFDTRGNYYPRRPAPATS